MNYTDQQLQLALAKKLPELIKIACGFPYWKPTGCADNVMEITPREWPWIVAEVEKKLTSAGEDEYVTYLSRLDTRYWSEVFATWQQRATALAHVGVITV